MKPLRLALPLLLLAAVLRGQSGNEVLLDIRSTAENPRNSEGAFLQLRSGRIEFYFSQFHGGSSDYSSARIAEVHSDDQGRTWSGPQAFAEKSGGMNLMSVSALRLASGQVAIFYGVKKSGVDCIPYMRTSSDEGATWSEPKRVIAAPGYFVLNNDRVIQTRSGRLIVPVAFNRPLVADGTKPVDEQRYNDLRGIVLWYLSDDEGATWREADSWWTMPIPSESGLQEPGVVQLTDGNLLSWARTDHGQFAFASHDNGKTWTPPEPTTMRTPISPASIKVLPGSSDLIGVYNDHSGRFPYPKVHRPYSGRSPLVVAISHDNGKTWPVAKAIETDLNQDYCYTAVEFVGDSIFLGYSASTRHGPHLGTLRIRRLTRAWLNAP